MLKNVVSLFRVPARIVGLDPDTLTRKLEQFRALPHGWHFGEGTSPTQEAISRALTVWATYRPFSLEADAFPGLDGSIMVVLYNGPRCLELTIEPSGESIQLVTQVGTGFNYQELRRVDHAREGDVFQEVSALVAQEHKWHSLESSIPGSMTGGYTASEVLVSPIRAREAVSHSWTLSVSNGSHLPRVCAAT